MVMDAPTLVDVYSTTNPYDLLLDIRQERPANANMTNAETQMPPYGEHVSFVNSRPYRGWYFVTDGDVVGMVYLTKDNDIGISIRAVHRGRGYGSWAIQALMAMFPGEDFTATIAPTNPHSIRTFEKLGFQWISDNTWQYFCSRDQE
jgi:RimJ/RimL family protein N-acetyltransferase